MKFWSVLLNRVPIRVHVWGGLGSQLFGCIVARRLSLLFPNRTTNIIFHSSGVTRRTLEIPQKLFLDFHVQNIDDYTVSRSNENHNSFSIYLTARILLIRLLARLGVLSRLNTDTEFLNLRASVFDVRGHYSQITLRKEEIDWLISGLGLNEKLANLNGDVSLHYRLGDLLKIQEKNPIDKKRVNKILHQVEGASSLRVFSDSTKEEIVDLLDTTLAFKSITVEKSSTLEVITKCLNCEVFIGTNSKISLWIAIFRRHLLSKGLTFIPSELIEQLEINSPGLTSDNGLQPY